MRPPPAPDDDALARARVQFLTAEPFAPQRVREVILASWHRSREFRVPADRIDLPYTADQNLDTPLIRSAEPVLRRLEDELDGQPISLILTDPTGVVLTQRTGDIDLHRYLEKVELVPGFSYGEQFVGTNGIGTALEDGKPRYVFGHEHYAEHLENLACAGVPIRHPLTGKTLGAIDLTCWRPDASGLLVALARTTAEQIRQALLTNSNIRELVLFQAYLQACRRTTDVVMAFNEDMVMMNDSARQLLDPADQAVVLGHATRALAEQARATAVVTLASGTKVRMQCRRVASHDEHESAGGVLAMKLIETTDERPGSPMVPMFLPGAVGSAPLWLRCAYEVDASYERGEWVVLSGEPGTGKHTLAKGVYQRRNPAGRLHTLDAADSTLAGWTDDLWRELIDDPVDVLVIRHADRLGADGVNALVAVLREVRNRGGSDTPWVAATIASDAEADSELADVLAFFPRTIDVPPLRSHVDDLRVLVPLLLGKLSHGGELTCSPAAMHLLMRASWPGNIEQLYRVLKQVAQHRRAGTIHPADLPAEYQSITRRTLNRLEAMERNAIVRSLEDADGNKAGAARLLGVSRATIYRKIREYGIVTAAH